MGESWPRRSLCVAGIISLLAGEVEAEYPLKFQHQGDLQDQVKGDSMIVAVGLALFTNFAVVYLVRLASRPPSPPTVAMTHVGTQTDGIVYRIQRP